MVLEQMLLPKPAAFSLTTIAFQYKNASHPLGVRAPFEVTTPTGRVTMPVRLIERMVRTAFLLEPRCDSARRGRLRFHRLLKLLEIIGDFLSRVLSKQPRNGCADRTSRRVILQHHGDPGALIVPCGLERDRPGMFHGRPAHCSPPNPFVFNLVDDFCVPFDRGRSRQRFNHPVGPPIIDNLHRSHMPHDLWQVVQLTPEPVELAGGPIDRHRVFDFQCAIGPDLSSADGRGVVVFPTADSHRPIGGAISAGGSMQEGDSQQCRDAAGHSGGTHHAAQKEATAQNA